MVKIEEVVNDYWLLTEGATITVRDFDYAFQYNRGWFIKGQPRGVPYTEEEWTSDSGNQSLPLDPVAGLKYFDFGKYDNKSDVSRQLAVDIGEDYISPYDNPESGKTLYEVGFTLSQPPPQPAPEPEPALEPVLKPVTDPKTVGIVEEKEKQYIGLLIMIRIGAVLFLASKYGY